MSMRARSTLRGGWLDWALSTGLGLRGGVLTARAPEVDPETLRLWTDVQSLIPCFGIPADAGAAATALRERDYFGAGLAVAGTIFEGADVLRILKRGTELLDNLPLQLHHFATNKHSTYTRRFEEILREHGINLSLEGDWNKEVLPHRGRHAEAYTTDGLLNR